MVCRLLWEYLTILGFLHVVKAVRVIRAISWEALIRHLSLQYATHPNVNIREIATR